MIAKVEFFAQATFLTHYVIRSSTGSGSTEYWIFFPIPSYPWLLLPSAKTHKLVLEHPEISTKRIEWALPHAICLTSKIELPRVKDLLRSDEGSIMGNLMTPWLWGSRPSWPIWFLPQTTKVLLDEAAADAHSHMLYCSSSWAYPISCWG